MNAGALAAVEFTALSNAAKNVQEGFCNATCIK